MTTADVIGKWSGLARPVRGIWAELKNNRRAAGGAILIAALIAGYGLILLSGAIAQMHLVHNQDVVRLHRIAAIAAEEQWPERARASGELRQAFERRLWLAESDGLARAAVEQWVTSAGSDCGLKQIQISSGLTESKEIPHLRRVTATVTAQSSEAALFAFLDRVERAPHLIVIRTLHVAGETDLSLDIVLVAYAKLGRVNGKVLR